MGGLRRLLQGNITRRAMRDGGGVWAGLAVLWYGARFIARVAERDVDVAHRSELKPGETITIRHTTMTRRDAAKADKLAAKQAKQAKKLAKKTAKALGA